jgi:KilA-N domain
MDIISRNFNGVAIGQRQSNGFINATAMCAAHGKKVDSWLRTQETFNLFDALAAQANTDFNYSNLSDLDKATLSASKYSRFFPELITVKRGSPSNGGGTWLHPDLAIQLAQWCNPCFAIMVSRWVRECLAEQVKPIAEEPKLLPSDPAVQLKANPISPDRSPAQIILAMAQQLVDQEQQLQAIAASQQHLTDRVTSIEVVQIEAKQDLLALPAPKNPVPVETTDAKVFRVVVNYAASTGIPHGDVWRSLYQQFRYRYRCIVTPQGCESKLQAFVRMGLADDLYDLAIELFAEPNKACINASPEQVSAQHGIAQTS